MNENLQSAVSDLSLIRQTMDKSRAQMKRLATLFFLYGGIQLAVMGAYLLWFVSGADTARADRIVLWVYHLVYMAIGVCAGWSGGGGCAGPTTTIRCTCTTPGAMPCC